MRKIDLTDFQVATSETARDINRRILLNLIRKHQPISRADLSRHSGLQRSTVSLITEQLIAERWVVEGAVGHAARGRKPTFLHLNGERAGVVGVDIRPGTTTIGLACLNMVFMAQVSLPTGRNPDKFIPEVAAHVRKLMQGHSEVTYEGMGVSLPGRVNLATHELVFAPNLGWAKRNLKAMFADATGLPVELENAANACALAELWSGRHPENVRNIVAVTVSEGIGVGMVLNGQIVRGPTGLAGEFGHVTLLENGPLCKCGNRGCWEACGSNSAAVRYYAEALSRSTKASSSLPSFEDILRLTDQGDAKAKEAIERMAYYLGAGLAMLMTALAPDLLVVIGEVTRAWSQVAPVIDGVLRDRLPTHPPTRIVPTDPALQPRLRGTIALVLQKHFGAPAVA
ncbi:MAG TPA: ROK family transcriptional regulator [Methylomirabilota bacterium]|nr:ROK family transcriptional regulator [Methylomirabilota bacterium]